MMKPLIGLGQRLQHALFAPVLGVGAFVGGVVLIVPGVGMWRNPEIDWQGFLLTESGQNGLVMKNEVFG